MNILKFKQSLLGCTFREGEGGGGGGGGGGEGGSSSSSESSSAGGGSNESAGSGYSSAADSNAAGGWSAADTSTPTAETTTAATPAAEPAAVDTPAVEAPAETPAETTATPVDQAANNNYGGFTTGSNSNPVNMSQADAAKAAQESNTPADGNGIAAGNSSGASKVDTGYSNGQIINGIATAASIAFPPLAAPIALARLGVGLYNDFSNPDVSSSDMIKNMLTGIIGGKISGAINNGVGNALGPDAAGLMRDYSQVSALSNSLQDNPADKVPTSVGGYIVGKALTGANADGVTNGYNGNAIDVSGWSSGPSSSGSSTATPAAATPATPAPVTTPAAPVSGIIGNYMNWFKQGQAATHNAGA